MATIPTPVERALRGELGEHKFSLTPFEMKALLDIWAESPWGSNACKALREETMRKLIEAGLIEMRGFDNVITDKGRAWVYRVLSTPLPVQRWSFPDDREA